MKTNISRDLRLDFTIDSSETVMFNQGGKHTLDFKELINRYDINFSEYDKIEISFQMQRDQMSRFGFINSEAEKHRKQCDEMNQFFSGISCTDAKEYEEAKKRMAELLEKNGNRETTS